MSALTRFLGDSPLRIFLKLLVISFLVGLVMNAFGWWPVDIFRWIGESISELWNMGFRAVANAAIYVVLGAAIVVPIFLVMRLLAYRRG
ncbi:MAG TPA: DUF6460 domain-containing protein [Rhizobiaceae bacterium]|nr:DUF6460 domain-containing protein [Rhizobiaceae bacterium]